MLQKQILERPFFSGVQRRDIVNDDALLGLPNQGTLFYPFPPQYVYGSTS